MHRSASAAVAAALATLACVPPALAGCPDWLLGLSVADGPNDRQFFATARAEALSDNDGSRDLAATEARLSAKTLLQGDARVPKSATGRLRGVIERAACANGTMVFVTVMLDETNARRAAALDAAIGASIRSSPPPVPPRP